MHGRLTYIILFVCVASASNCFSQLGFDLCDKQKALHNLKVVEQNGHILFSKSNDSCVLSFLDTLTSRFIKTGERKYIVALDSLCNSADGYVSEYFWEIGERLAFQSFSNFTGYLSESKSKCLYNSMAMLTYSYNGKTGWGELRVLIDKEFEKDITDKKREYLLWLKEYMQK